MTSRVARSKSCRRFRARSTTRRSSPDQDDVGARLRTFLGLSGASTAHGWTALPSRNCTAHVTAWRCRARPCNMDLADAALLTSRRPIAAVAKRGLTVPACRSSGRPAPSCCGAEFNHERVVNEIQLSLTIQSRPPLPFNPRKKIHLRVSSAAATHRGHHRRVPARISAGPRSRRGAPADAGSHREASAASPSRNRSPNS